MNITINIIFMQTSNNDDYRYPSKYIARDASSTHNNINNKTTKKLNNFIEPPDNNDNDTHIVIDSYRDEIINMLSNDNYYALSKLINPELFIGGKHIFDFDSEENKDASLVVNYTSNNTTNKIDTFPILIKYCFVRNDLELLKILITKSDEITKSLFVTQLGWSYSHSNLIYDPNNHELVRIIIENIKCDESDVESIIGSIIKLNNSNNKIFFLDLMAEYGYHISYNQIRSAIIHNKTDIVQYAISRKNFNVQNVVDTSFDYAKIYRNYNTDTMQGCNITIMMLKLLLDNNINLRNNLKNIFTDCVDSGNLDSVSFLLETFSAEININDAFNSACLGNHINIMTYLLKFGADVNSLIYNTPWNIKFDTFKFLLESGYSPVAQFEFDTLHQHLLHHLLGQFVNNACLDNTHYLVKKGANMNWLVQDIPLCHFDDYNKAKQFMLDGNMLDKVNVRSPLEFVVMSGKLTHIKFLFENYFDLIKPHLNRLFVVACANGQNQIASYLLDYGAELSFRALTSACFFGHYETVVMLLKLGMTVDLPKVNSISQNTSINLCSSVFGGNSNYRYDPNYSDINRDLCYYAFISHDDIFRNDIYNFGTNKTYVDILKLLITYNVPRLRHHTACLGEMPEEFYDIDIFKYFILDGDNLINLVYNARSPKSLLESSIVHEKLDVIEFLLQKGAKGPIVNSYARMKIENRPTIMNMLMRYGIEV